MMAAAVVVGFAVVGAVDVIVVVAVVVFPALYFH